MGKIRKILETELVGGTQSTDVYPVTSTKAVFDGNNKDLDTILAEMNNKITIFPFSNEKDASKYIKELYLQGLPDDISKILKVELKNSPGKYHSVNIYNGDTTIAAYYSTDNLSTLKKIVPLKQWGNSGVTGYIFIDFSNFPSKSTVLRINVFSSYTSDINFSPSINQLLFKNTVEPSINKIPLIESNQEDLEIKTTIQSKSIEINSKDIEGIINGESTLIEELNTFNWEIGSISSSTGNNENYKNNLRTPVNNYYPVSAVNGKNVVFKGNSNNHRLFIFFYDENKQIVEADTYYNSLSPTGKGIAAQFLPTFTVKKIIIDESVVKFVRINIRTIEDLKFTDTSFADNFAFDITKSYKVNLAKRVEKVYYEDLDKEIIKKLVLDEVPTEGSNNAAKSGGIYTAIKEQEAGVIAVKEEAIGEINSNKESSINQVNSEGQRVIQSISEQRVTPNMLSEETIQLINASGGGSVTNLPDGETISVKKLPDGNSLLTLPNREAGNSLGYVILAKNQSLLEQIVNENTIYEVRFEYDLNRETLNMPSNCYLLFNGGVIKNGILVGNSTIINTNKVNCKVKGTFCNTLGENINISGKSDIDTLYVSNQSEFEKAMQQINSSTEDTVIRLLKGDYLLKTDITTNSNLTIISDGANIHGYDESYNYSEAVRYTDTHYICKLKKKIPYFSMFVDGDNQLVRVSETVDEGILVNRVSSSLIEEGENFKIPTDLILNENNLENSYGFLNSNWVSPVFKCVSLGEGFIVCNSLIQRYKNNFTELIGGDKEDTTFVIFNNSIKEGCVYYDNEEIYIPLNVGSLFVVYNTNIDGENKVARLNVTGNLSIVGVNFLNMLQCINHKTGSETTKFSIINSNIKNILNYFAVFSQGSSVCNANISNIKGINVGMYEGGGACIQSGAYNFDSTFTFINNKICRYNKVCYYKNSFPLVIHQRDSIIARYNELYNSPRDFIFVRYGKSYIEYNKLYLTEDFIKYKYRNLGADTGAIYLPIQSTTVDEINNRTHFTYVRYNTIYNFMGRKDDNNGIYLDVGRNSVECSYNVIGQCQKYSIDARIIAEKEICSADIHYKNNILFSPYRLTHKGEGVPLPTITENISLYSEEDNNINITYTKPDIVTDKMILKEGIVYIDSTIYNQLPKELKNISINMKNMIF